MPRIVNFNEERIKSTPGAKYGWFRKAGNILAANKLVNYLMYHVMVEKDSGEVNNDLVLQAKYGGGIIIPIRRNDGKVEIGLQESWRVQTRDFPKYRKTFPHIDFRDLGRISLELPRGFGNINETPEQTILREAEEEIGCRVVSVKYLQDIVGDTANEPHFNACSVVEIDDSQRTDHLKDEHELIINRLKFFTVDDVIRKCKGGEIYCCYTLTGISLLFLYHPDLFLK